MSKGPVYSVGPCQPKILANDSLKDEKGKPQTSFHGTISFPVAVLQSWNTLPMAPSWSHLCFSNSRQLVENITPREVKLKTSVQNVLRHSSSSLIIKAAF